MAVYLVSYDLKAGANYDPLIKAIKAFGTWWHHLDSTWLVVSEMSAIQLRDHLRPFLEGHEVLVIEITGCAWATWGLPDDANKWLLDMIPMAYRRVA